MDRGHCVDHRRLVQTPADPVRRLDLDWIRVSAFGLLILYHVGLVYAPYDWHVHSVHTFEWMREGVLITNPWRLTLLFLVSGAALRFMTRRRRAGQVAKARAERLIPPLIFGTLLLVPIQSWIEAMDKGGWDRGFVAWWAREFSLSGIANGIPVNHLWFIVYIAAYSAVAILLMTRPETIARAEAALTRLLAAHRVIWVPILYLIVIRLILFPMFGITNRLSHDWYNHALSLGAFLFGFLIVRQESLWRDLERYRWVGVALAVIALPIMMMQTAHPGGGAFWGIPRGVVFAIDQWAVILAVLGFGSRHLRRADSPVLRYVTDAVFPCYLAHQTILVVAVWLIQARGWPAPVEASVLVVVTVGGSLLVYEIVRRIPLIRPIWGLKPIKASKPGPTDMRAARDGDPA